MGEFPHIFFPLCRCLPTRFSLPIRDHIAGLGFELVDLRRTGTLQRPILQVRVDRPDSRPGQGVTADDCAGISRSLEALPGIQGDGRAALRAGGLLARASSGRCGGRSTGAGSSGGGRGSARRPLRGTPRVEIVAVPDDEHVVLRLEDGAEVTLALDDDPRGDTGGGLGAPSANGGPDVRGVNDDGWFD